MRHLFTLDYQDYDPAWPHVYRPSVRAIIIRDGRVAMVRSGLYDYYKFPGGGMEPGESQIDTLLREAMEEAGLAILPETVRPFGYVRRLQGRPDRTIFDQDNYYYIARAQDTIYPQHLDEGEAKQGFTLEFVDPAQAIATNRKPQHGPFEEAMQERECRILELLVEEGYFASGD